MTLWMSHWIFPRLLAQANGGDAATCPRNLCRFFGTGSMSTDTMLILQSKKKRCYPDKHTFPHYRYLKKWFSLLKELFSLLIHLWSSHGYKCLHCMWDFLFYGYSPADGTHKERLETDYVLRWSLFIGNKIIFLGEQTVMNWSMHANFLQNSAPKDMKCLYKVIYCEKKVFICQQRFYGDRWAA